jgi:hypothetical protein
MIIFGIYGRVDSIVLKKHIIRFSIGWGSGWLRFEFGADALGR